MGSHLLGDSACDINSDFGILLIMCPSSVFVVTVRDAEGVIFLWEHRLNARSFKDFPAPSGLDFAGAGMAEDYYLVCNSLVNELHQSLVLERFCKEAKSSRMSPNEPFFELYRRKARAAARRSLAIVSALVG
jgi:hypothetical protein